MSRSVTDRLRKTLVDQNRVIFHALYIRGRLLKKLREVLANAENREDIKIELLRETEQLIDNFICDSITPGLKTHVRTDGKPGAIFVAHENLDGNFNGFVYGRAKNSSLLRHGPVRITNDQGVMVTKSREEPQIITRQAARESSEVWNQRFDFGVREKVGEEIENFGAYYYDRVSLVAFNFGSGKTNGFHLISLANLTIDLAYIYEIVRQSTGLRISQIFS